MELIDWKGWHLDHGRMLEEGYRGYRGYGPHKYVPKGPQRIYGIWIEPEAVCESLQCGPIEQLFASVPSSLLYGVELELFLSLIGPDCPLSVRMRPDSNSIWYAVEDLRK